MTDFKLFCLICLCFFALPAGAQDCPDFIEISNSETVFAAPAGPGVQEIGRNPAKSLHYFQNEHHTVWLTFRAKKDCQLTFEITPEQVRDDYDFLLFRTGTEDKNFCEKIKNKTLRPLRTNISRNNQEIGSKTGLRADASDDFVHSGPGPDYSRAVDAKKGDLFILHIDNVYKGGKGFKINVLDCLEEEKVIVREEPVVLVPEPVIEEPEPEIEPVDPEVLLSQETEKELSRLDSLTEIGDSFTLDKLYFHGNTAFLQNESKAQIQALLGVMQKHETMRIKLHSHTNGTSRQYYSAPKKPESDIFAPTDRWCFDEANGRVFFGHSDELSEERAESIRNFLITNGIDKKRLKIKNWGAKRMLRDEFAADAHLNRRVEVEILSE